MQPFTECWGYSKAPNYLFHLLHYSFLCAQQHRHLLTFGSSGFQWIPSEKLIQLPKGHKTHPAKEWNFFIWFYKLNSLNNKSEPAQRVGQDTVPTNRSQPDEGKGRSWTTPLEVFWLHKCLRWAQLSNSRQRLINGNCLSWTCLGPEIRDICHLMQAATCADAACS